MSFEVIFVTPCYIRLFKICKICLPFQNWWKQTVKYKYQDIQGFSSKPKICATSQDFNFRRFFHYNNDFGQNYIFGVYCGLKYSFRFYFCKSNNTFSSSSYNALPFTVYYGKFFSTDNLDDQAMSTFQLKIFGPSRSARYWDHCAQHDAQIFAWFPDRRVFKILDFEQWISLES